MSSAKPGLLKMQGLFSYSDSQSVASIDASDFAVAGFGAPETCLPQGLGRFASAKTVAESSSASISTSIGAGSNDNVAVCTSRRVKRPPGRFPPSAVRTLQRWLLDHSESPYATLHDQDELKTKTGLKRSQILSWLANARKRGKVRPPPSVSPRAFIKEGRSVFADPKIAQMLPYNRWLYAGPETEAASLSAILAAVETSDSEQDEALDAPMLSRPHGGGNWQFYHENSPSISSMEIRSYAANAKSVTSEEWKRPYGASVYPLTKRRRHRREPPRQDATPTVSRTSSTQPKIFQCTFCSASFRRKHDWQRYEKSQHLPVERWVCCSQGSVAVNSATNEVSCIFCGAFDPDPTHVELHGFSQCVARPSSERTFLRKDHLVQHLRLLHGGCPFSPSMEAWKDTEGEFHSRCGFCDNLLTSWDERVDHLADHFRDGAQISDWHGDWGFEPKVLETLERAILPEARQESIKEGSLDFGDYSHNDESTRYGWHFTSQLN